MIRRVCFDIQSSYFCGPAVWLDDPYQARLHFRNTSFRFWAATAFDDAAERYTDFDGCEELFATLIKADEIITFNGRKCDLIVLDSLMGEDACKSLWQKTHHDLTGWRGYWRLKDAVQNLLPESASQFESTCSKQRAHLTDCGWKDRMLKDLSDTYRDVFFTYELFRKYRASGDSDRTYRDFDLVFEMYHPAE